jgi:large subunit ribosomal protein L24
MDKLYKIRLKKGDTVVMRAGAQKGKSGKIVAVHPKTNKVTVEGLNIAKKHVKPTKSNPTGGIVELTRPINVSKVGIIDPSTKKASKIAFKIKGDKKVRIFAQSGKEI